MRLTGPRGLLRWLVIVLVLAQLPGAFRADTVQADDEVEAGDAADTEDTDDAGVGDWILRLFRGLDDDTGRPSGNAADGGDGDGGDNGGDSGGDDGGDDGGGGDNGGGDDGGDD